MSIDSIVNTHTNVHMKNEEYRYPRIRIRSDSASSFSSARSNLSIYNRRMRWVEKRKTKYPVQGKTSTTRIRM
jgi:hypothetical protein